MPLRELPFTELLSHITDNRGRTCPTAPLGRPLIATNCISNDRLYPSYDTERFVSEETYRTWFRAHPAPGDIIFVCKGSPGRVALAPDPVDFCIAQDMVAVRADPMKIYPRYLFAALRSQTVQDRIENMHVGTLIPHFKKGDFDKLDIPLPDRAEQELIGDTYFELSAKIEQNRRTAAKLEGLARATFRAWFVDFGPVRAKAAGATAYPGLPPAAFAALPTTFTDSPLGPIPEGWEVKPLKVVVKLTMGQSPSSEFYNESGEGLPFHQGVSDHGFRFPSRRVYCTAEGRMANAGDVLLSVRAPVGRINVADTRMVLGRGLAGMRHRQGNQSFLLYLMQHHFAEDDAVGDGTIYKAVNKDFLEAMPLIAAASKVEAAFERVFAPMDALIASLMRESERLAALRDYLLPRLLSGSVRVRTKSDVRGGRDAEDQTVDSGAVRGATSRGDALSAEQRLRPPDRGD